MARSSVSVITATRAYRRGRFSLPRYISVSSVDVTCRERTSWARSVTGREREFASRFAGPLEAPGDACNGRRSTRMGRDRKSPGSTGLKWRAGTTAFGIPIVRSCGVPLPHRVHFLHHEFEFLVLAEVEPGDAHGSADVSLRVSSLLPLVACAPTARPAAPSPPTRAPTADAMNARRSKRPAYRGRDSLRWSWDMIITLRGGARPVDLRNVVGRWGATRPAAAGRLRQFAMPARRPTQPKSAAPGWGRRALEGIQHGGRPHRGAVSPSPRMSLRRRHTRASQAHNRSNHSWSSR